MSRSMVRRARNAPHGCQSACGGPAPPLVLSGCRVSGQRRRAHRLAQDPWLCPLLPVDRPASLKTDARFHGHLYCSRVSAAGFCGRTRDSVFADRSVVLVQRDARRSNQPWQSSARRRDSEIRADGARASRDKRRACRRSPIAAPGRNAVARDDWAAAARGEWEKSAARLLQAPDLYVVRDLAARRTTSLSAAALGHSLAGKRTGDRTAGHGVAYTSVSPRQPRAAIALALSSAGDAVICQRRGADRRAPSAAGSASRGGAPFEFPVRLRDTFGGRLPFAADRIPDPQAVPLRSDCAGDGDRTLVVGIRSGVCTSGCTIQPTCLAACCSVRRRRASSGCPLRDPQRRPRREDCRRLAVNRSGPHRETRPSGARCNARAPRACPPRHRAGRGHGWRGKRGSSRDPRR